MAEYVEIRSIYMPYCIQRLDGRRYVILNRNYKPIGMRTADYIDYTQHGVEITGLGPATITKLSYEGSNNPANIFLYDDASNPTRSQANMDAYINRLAILARLKIR